MESTKKAVKQWVRENIRRKGEDAILWGKWEEEDLECEKLEETCPKPYWSEKIMRRRGQPPRKKQQMIIREVEDQGGEDEKEVIGRGEDVEGEEEESSLGEEQEGES